MFPVLIRTLIIYITLIASIRLTGKRQVGEMQLSELITAFLISEVAASPLADPDIPLVYGVVPILLLISLEIVISFVTTKSVILKRMFAHSLSLIGKDSAWLDAKLKSDRRRAEDIFLMTSDGNRVFYVGQEKEKKK